MTADVQITRSQGVLTLTLDRVAKKNALTDAMYAALADAIDAAQSDREVRVVVLRGEGDMFTAGNDVGEFAAVAMGGPLPHQVTRFLRALAHADKPLVAGVQGRAVGIGTTLLLHCDYVVLADDAKLSAPFVSLALVPEAASSALLPARIGHPRAFAMFALGEVVAAADAVAWGLANAVVPVARLTTTLDGVARRLAQQPLGALVATKRLMRSPSALAATMEAETNVFMERLRTAEAREAFAAFAARRPPDFSKLA